MSYHDDKKRVIDIIEKLAEKSLYKPEEIAFNILRLTGFSKSFVIKYIREGTENRLFFLTEEGYVTTTKPGEDENAQVTISRRKGKSSIKKLNNKKSFDNSKEEPKSL